MPAALSHVTVGASDFAASLAFYDAALAPLGLTRIVEYVDEEEGDTPVEAAAWGSGEPMVWLVAAEPTRHAHVAFRTDDRAAVDAFHAAAVAAGGASSAAPRRWAIYRRGRYGAIVRDPDGNLLEVTAPE